MTIRIKINSLKNAMGTMFLLAAAFFVCSTLVSMRSVFADPIVQQNVVTQTSGRVSPRSTTRASNRTVSRSTVASRSMAAVNNAPQNSEKATVSRGTGTRKVSSRSITPTRSTNSATTRKVAPRVQKSATNTNSSRAVRARTASGTSRVGTSGSVMAGARASSTSYSYLASKLYTGSYSDIVDSSTGLISADAYSNCMDSYYACMDEICTARSDTKGRCSCAGRATNFLDAEEALEAANEELIKLSGQLTLLIATKGKGDDLSYAFSLTDAEKVMNCVSYKETMAQYGSGSSAADAKKVKEWCYSHGMYSDTCSQPSYCTSNDFGFDVGDIDGSSSDILAQLKAWADAKDLAKQYTDDDSNNLFTKYSYVSGTVNSLSSITGDTDSASIDTLANKWGYKLFEYAHNNVCGRVLDSCFNGIYEACGTPVSVTDSDGKTHSKCGNGASSNCPFNYNSYISVVTSGDNSGDVKLNERSSGNSTITSSATCFGYSTTTSTSTTTRSGTTTTTTDPYATLRGPVADARRSIMQKYLLDANAACDVYGNALKQTAQNINYQKIAAEQALQQKRLEFKQEEEDQRFADARTAIDNFNECISEIWDCYEEYEDEDNWTTARIKSYCSQVSQVPHCYEQMICAPLQTQLIAVVDKADNKSCAYSNDYKENTCRNIVTINEIMYGTGQDADDKLDNWDSVGKINVSSAAVREQCLERSLGCLVNGTATDNEKTYCLRTWKKGDIKEGTTQNGTGTIGSGSQSGAVSCSAALLNTYNAASGYISGNDCVITECKSDFELSGNRCIRKECSYATLNNMGATSGHIYNNSCVAESCASDFDLTDGTCVRKSCSTTTLEDNHASSGHIYNGSCVIEDCVSGYGLSNGRCIKLSEGE